MLFSLFLFHSNSLHCHAIDTELVTDDCQLVANSSHRRLRSDVIDTCIISWTSFTMSPVHGFGTLCQWNFVSQTLNLSHFDSCFNFDLFV